MAFWGFSGQAIEEEKSGHDLWRFGYILARLGARGWRREKAGKREEGVGSRRAGRREKGGGSRE
jgi:hypothetical protein